MKGADLFAGLGGSSEGARQAGVEVVWAANHWQPAVNAHALNHPEAIHVCQDLHQADWSLVPKHDVMMASPCCQGHSKARGRKAGNPQHDASRSTAWAVVAAAECLEPPSIIVENVREFLEWSLYPSWKSALEALGYSVAPHVVDCADLGVPQNRIRLFIVCTKSKNPLFLNLPKLPHKGADTFIDFTKGKWSLVNKPRRAIATLERVKAGRKRFGDRFLMPYYGNGSGLTGRCLSRPIGTITTRDRWAVVDGDRMRMIIGDEVMAGMSFPEHYQRPNSHQLVVNMAGNAVPPLAMCEILIALRKQV